MGKTKVNTNKLTVRASDLIRTANYYTYKDIQDVLFKPAHPSSLAVARILFGFLMFLDVADERAGSHIDIRWGDPNSCHFPLFPQLTKFTLPWMCLLYGLMWIGAIGICLGYKFKFSCLAFGIPYWYILLLDKSYWNNHSYLYGLCTILFFASSANSYWSLDSFLKRKKEYIPNWNYLMFKFQFFILYFYAGLKKTDMEWLEGYSMTNLGKHWVFTPFTVLLTMGQIDYLIVHWSGFILDLTVGFFLLCSKTRPIAMIFCSMFHVMNTRLFSIGMFPYVCLATLPLFCEQNWPIKLLTSFKISSNTKEELTYPKDKFSSKRQVTVALLAVYCFVQLFLPFSHFITKGYNNWTNGLYGYSWDMMVHSWDTTLVVVRVVDNEAKKEHYLDDGAWVSNSRWNKHADMCVQYANCLKNNLLQDLEGSPMQNSRQITSSNLSIYIDVWCSLNGRFQQRMFDPNYDLLKARWSPFEEVEWLLPLLTGYSSFREKMLTIEEHVYSWSNYSDVLFIADFPGMYLENFITKDLVNVSLTIIEGEIYYESENFDIGFKLKEGESIPIRSEIFHRIMTISRTPSTYMYTFTNKTKALLGEEHSSSERRRMHSLVPLLEDSTYWMEKLGDMLKLLYSAILDIVFDVPMFVRR